MTQVTESSAPTKSPLTPSDLHAGTGATTPSPGYAQDAEHNIERCIQDMDPSRSLTVSYVEGCNLECSYCALRWSARRVIERQGS
jgi:hypothetical protein